MTTRGMGPCRFCTNLISNVDYHLSAADGTQLIICGALWHYMQRHFVSLAPALRQQVMAIDPATVTAGKTVAYRSSSSLRIFFYEEHDGVHTVGQTVDVELFNHVRLLVLKCQATDVPPALPAGSGTAAGGVAPSSQYDALLEQLKHEPGQKKTTKWKVMAGAACRKLNDDLKGVNLGDLADDADRRSTFQQLVQTAFQKAGFGSEVIRVIGFAGFPKAQELLVEDTVGLYPKGAVNLRAYTDGSYAYIYLERVNEYGNLR